MSGQADSTTTASAKLSQSRSLMKPYAYIVVAFIVSRLLYFIAGLRFDASTLGNLWPIVDPQLLKENLFQSIYYLHFQPPLFNLYIGSVLNLFPGHALLVFNISYLALGLLLGISLFLLMNRLGVSVGIATLLTILFIVSPSVVLYENLLFYTYPLAAFLVATALFLHRFVSSSKVREGTILFALLAALVLTRNLFHIFWFVFSVVLILAFQKHNWKKIVLAASIPFVVVVFVYGKNLVLFGSPTTSTWMGMNLYEVTTQRLSENQRRSLFEQGKISELSLIPSFRALRDYQAFLPKTEKENIPVLYQEFTSSGGPNFNNIAYIDIDRQYLKDSIQALLSHPEAHLKSQLRAYFAYFLSSSDNFFVEGNRQRIQYADRLFNLLFYGRVLQHDETTVTRYAKLLQHEEPPLTRENIATIYLPMTLNLGLFLLVGLPLLVFYGLRLAIKSLSQRAPDLPSRLTLLFMCITVVLVTLVGNSFAAGENNRFRFMVDPFFVVLLGLFLNARFNKHRNPG